jgi:transposase-like protein
MQTGTFEKFSDKFDGAVEVDETYIGGKARNMHARSRQKRGINRSNFAGKVGVVGFYQRGGHIQLTVIDSTRKVPLQAEIRKRVKSGSTVYTDELKSYKGLDRSYVHKVVNHAETYVNGQVHTNGIENFWSLLKRGLSGTYVSVRPFHLFRYLDEQVYRFNHRGGEDGDRFVGVLGQAPGRQLTWKELTARTMPDPRMPDPRPVSRHAMGPF